MVTTNRDDKKRKEKTPKWMCGPADVCRRSDFPADPGRGFLKRPPTPHSHPTATHFPSHPPPVFPFFFPKIFFIFISPAQDKSWTAVHWRIRWIQLWWDPLNFNWLNFKWISLKNRLIRKLPRAHLFRWLGSGHWTSLCSWLINQIQNFPFKGHLRSTTRSFCTCPFSLVPRSRRVDLRWPVDGRCVHVAKTRHMWRALWCH